jgi:nucleotide-binding universal stress UspA family protein
MSMLSNDIGYCREKTLMKSILVPTGGSDTDSPLFETALAVARLFSSHLQFLHIHIGAGEAALNVPHAEFAMGPALSNALEELEQSATIRSATAFRHFRDFCARSSIAMCDAPTYPTGVTASWHEQPGKALKRIMFFARHSDLVVVGRARKANGMTTDFIEQLLVNSGRPVLIAPSAPRQTLTNTIMVCWRETAEAVRAFNAAMPFLANAKRVLVTSVTEKGEYADESVGAVVRQLSFHRIPAEEQVIKANGGSVPQLIASAAQACDADLVVLGAYGHSPMREALFGGCTQSFIHHADRPVLLMH